MHTAHRRSAQLNAAVFYLQYIQTTYIVRELMVFQRNKRMDATIFRFWIACSSNGTQFYLYCSVCTFNVTIFIFLRLYCHTKYRVIISPILTALAGLKIHAKLSPITWNTSRWNAKLNSIVTMITSIFSQTNEHAETHLFIPKSQKMRFVFLYLPRYLVDTRAIVASYNVSFCVCVCCTCTTRLRKQ